MRKISSRDLAWGIAGTSVLLMLVGISLSVIYILQTGTYRQLLSHQALVPLSTLAYALVGALVAGRHPRNPIGWMFAVVGLLSGLNAVGMGFSAQASLGPPHSPLGLGMMEWINRWTWIPSVLLPTVFVFLYFPDGTLLSRRWRPVAWAGMLGMAMVVGGIMLYPGPIESWGVEGDNPIGLRGSATALRPVIDAGSALLVVGFIGSVMALFLRFRRSRGVRRQQMKWLVYACGWMLASFGGASVIWMGLQNDALAEELSIVTSSLAVLAIAVAASVAILRHRLYDIDLLINRTLVYAALTGSVAGLYVLVVGAASLALQANRVYAALILTALFGIPLFSPLRDLFQRGADRLIPPKTPGRPTGAAVRSPAVDSAQQGSRAAGAWMRWAQWLWIPAAGLAVVLALLSLPAYAIGLGEGPPDMVADRGSLGGFLLAVDALNALLSLATVAISLVLAWILYRNRRRDPMALFLAYYFPLYGVVIAGPLEELTRVIPLSLESVLTVEAALFAFPSVLLLFLFPDGRFVPRWSRWIALGSLGALPLLVLSPPFIGFELQAPRTWVGVAAWLLLGWTGIGAQIYRYRRVSTPVERQQTKIAVAGIVLWIALMGLLSVPYVLRQRIPASMPMPWWAPLSELAWYAGLTILPVALTLAVLRYRLWDIDLALNRALGYAALSATVIALYVLIVGSLGALFQSRGSFAISLVATGLVAVMFQPMRDRLQRGVNRLMYGERDDPYKVLSELGQRLEATLAPHQVLPTIVEAVAQALKLPYTAIELHEGERTRIAAEYGRPIEQPIAVPLKYQGERIGRLLCGARGPGEAFNAAEQTLLSNLAYQAGLAVHAVQLTEDLQRSRERLVMTREEERRRLRRDLHDGLGPELAGMMLKLDAAQNQIRRDPETADRLLNDLKSQTQGALADIRRLVYNLRPPALDELGLLEAVRQRVDVQGAANGPSVRVVGPELPDSLPAAVEVAAYRIALEAVTNVTRHARASRCEVRFDVGSELEIEVLDDGCGVGENVSSGVGLTSMRERASELGGSVGLERRPEGGSRLYARLPLGAEGQ